jgi:ABC-type sugar transport system substrate-binding protein
MTLSRRTFTSLGLSLLSVAIVAGPIWAQGAAETDAMTQMVDTSRFKKDGPYKIGVSAGWLSASWVVYSRQYILWAADEHKTDVAQVIVTDAAFNPSKQVADIEDLLRQEIDLLIYWAVDDKAIADVLQRVVDAGIPTVNAYGSFVDAPGTISNAVVSQYRHGDMVARQLMKDINGEGKVIAILPIAGTSASHDLLEALNVVLKEYPDVELVNVSYGDYNRAKSKQVAENLLQRYPDAAGIFSPSGNQSIGIAEAVDEAGLLGTIKMSPSDELNAWVKWVIANQQGGVVTYSPVVGRVALELGLKILKGEPVPRGEVIPSEYYSPEDAQNLVRNDLPDDAWPGTLPDAFLPQ